jgi:hypothetical protein
LNRSGISAADIVTEIAIQDHSYLSTSLPINSGEADALLLWEKCHAVQHETASADMSSALAAGTAVVFSGALTVGYIVWMLRSGFLVASCMSSVPAWMTFDPLPILDSSTMTGAAAAEASKEDQSLVELVGGAELDAQPHVTDQP